MAILTISREFGSGGQEIGKAVAQTEGYDYLSKDKIFEEIKAAGGKWKEWAENLDEQTPSIWERFDWSFKGFLALIENIILTHALNDNVVITGRGGNYILAGIPHVLRLRVEAPMEQRIDRIIKREGIDRKNALDMVKKVDHDRAGFIHTVFDKKIDDPADYDMILNTGDMSIEQAVVLVKKRLNEKNALKTEAARKELEMRVKASNIKRKLLTNASLSTITTLDVIQERGKIILESVVKNPEEEEKLEKAARLAAEGESIIYKIRMRV